jgi:hypothetical protein
MSADKRIFLFFFLSFLWFIFCYYFIDYFPHNNTRNVPWALISFFVSFFFIFGPVYLLFKYFQNMSKSNIDQDNNMTNKAGEIKKKKATKSKKANEKKEEEDKYAYVKKFNEVRLFDIDGNQYRYMFDVSNLTDDLRSTLILIAKEYHNSLNRPKIPDGAENVINFPWAEDLKSLSRDNKNAYEIVPVKGIELAVKKVNEKYTEKWVYTNKELRETLKSLDLNDDTIDSIDIKIFFKKWATYEPGVNYVNLEYKGYKYEVHGFLVEKGSDPELFYYDEQDGENAYPIGLFLEKIQDKEISVLEDYLGYRVNGESDSWFPNNKLEGDNISDRYPLNENLESVKWIDETPEEIRAEFEKEFKENNYHDVVYEGDEEYDDGDWEFFNKSNNIYSIILNANVGEKKYKIIWLNK